MFKPRSSLSQNFLYNRQLIQKLIRISSIDAGDVVIEIGAGAGAITKELQRTAKLVIALEIDERLIAALLKTADNNTVLFKLDALKFNLPVSPYKVFSNPPFAIEGRLLRKLLNAQQPPTESHLVVRKEHALRWAGVYRNTRFSSFYLPWFEFNIVHQFKSADFKPQTKVKAVMLQITKRNQPAIAWEDKGGYQRFVKTGFGSGQSINHNLDQFFSKQTLIKITSEMGLSYKSKPADLKYSDWQNLFLAYRRK
mgnify:CR=1 FL=1